MAENQFNAAVDGQEFAIGDANALGVTAGLADDRLLAELLRLPNFDGTSVYKTILPYSQGVLTPGASIVLPGTVQPTGSANGSINVMPFRAVVGSRVTAASNPLAAWRDIRSSVSVGASALAQTFALSPNSSGNPRWDLVYASVTVDLPSGGQVRRVKNPSTGAITAPVETTYLANPVTVTVLTGTPGATPSIPSLPDDSGGVYNIAIAAVRVVNGFNSTHTVLTPDIRDQVAVSPGQSPTMGTTRMMPASGNNDQSGTYTSDTAGPGVWTASSSGQRPGPFLPPSMVGVESRTAIVDLFTTAHPSHSSGSIVDASIDWRNRFVRVTAVASPNKFPNDPTAGVNTVPQSTQGQMRELVGTQISDYQVGNTFVGDGKLVSSRATVVIMTQDIGLPSGAIVGIYVDSTSGNLLWFNNGTATNLRYFFWIEATAQLPNT